MSEWHLPALAELNLSAVRRILEERRGWRPERTLEVEQCYRRLLAALASYDPKRQSLTLSPEVAEFWRTHILFTGEYSAFCRKAYGRHMPYHLTVKDEVWDAIESLDLEFQKRRLMNPLTGYGWSRDRATRVEKLYHRFLFLNAASAGIEQAPVPTEDIDALWHLHILDHARYSRDCERIFGSYLHHTPTPVEELGESIEATEAAYRELFGEAIYGGE